MSSGFYSKSLSHVDCAPNHRREFLYEIGKWIGVSKEGKLNVFMHGSHVKTKPFLPLSEIIK
jgi:hypothetical protein